MHKINTMEPVTEQSLSLSPLFWQLVGVMALAVRLVSGWTYWGGASRRLIYDLAKLDPTSPAYLANKLVHAAPGMAFDLSGVMYWLLAHPVLLHIAIIFFTLVELVVGVGLIIGFATRFMSFIGLGLSVTLMIIFGWMGTTCLDEWTMAACGFAMSAVVLVTGGGKCAVDQLLLPMIERSGARWLVWLTSGPLPLTTRQVMKFASTMAVISIVFTVGFYGYNFGALITPLGKRLDNAHPTVTLSDATLMDHHLRVATYIKTGPDTQGAYVTKVSLIQQEQTLISYQAADLKDPAKVVLKNQFAPWSTCKAMAYAVRCQLGSKANWVITLPADLTMDDHKPLTVEFTDVEGKNYTALVELH
ncbi:hypothetical protein CWC46_12735 [Prodigiosinella confusarubida]|uniref:Quinol oxidase n=1 Tax=Serratia sp. (strain ATCC 39006) TaxID=104623 RepID=A0A2I5TK37_SERS3|nr:TQO small subunit DoxD [Serratia sp. ATCC 39006]AUH00599.1 hypothetical protein CWC46_12735 [Serratia sp. ATCC 39006]AUH04920.1 hypothetical protein Ser39006_012740 [Serratia sp. ATCC 39006]